MKVCFDTFGCRLNKAEALQMEAEYLAAGWELTDEHSEADLFVVRGCSVTARAQYECEKLIYHLRRHYPHIPLHVCGCLKTKIDTSALQLQLQTTTNSPLPLRTARAYLKVQDGCSGTCTFCIVPKFRGTSVSVPFTGLLDKAKRFIDSGYHEIVVTGCNLSLYCSEGKRLPDLLSALAELSSSKDLKPSPLNLKPSSCRIRLGSLEPGACALETVRVMAEHANICRFLHIPVQSGSDRILSAMKRPYLVRDVENLVVSATKHLPGLGLGCDLMTGFPGETDLDFAATQEMLLRLPFNNAHVFPYSERPGTPAERFGGALPKEIRSQRAYVLTDIVRGTRWNFARQFLGKTVKVIVEDTDKTVGWTSEYLKCEAAESMPRKSLVRIHVTGIRDDKLFGHVIA